MTSCDSKMATVAQKWEPPDWVQPQELAVARVYRAPEVDPCRLLEVRRYPQLEGQPWLDLHLLVVQELAEVWRKLLEMIRQ